MKKKKRYKHRYTPEQIKYLKQIYKGRHISEITKLFNKRFKLSQTENSIKSAAQNRGIKSGYKHRPTHSQKYFDRHISFIKKHLPGNHYAEFVPKFNERFGMKVTIMQMISLCKRLGVKTGFTGQFPKGHIPQNKGKKGLYYAGCEKTWFKLGHRPENWRPVGSERVNVNGYIEIKVAEPNKWKCKHISIWEKENGPVPKRHCVIFLNGNKNDLNLDNFMLISREAHAVMCHMKLFTNNRKITKNNCALVMLKVGISKKKRESFSSIKNKSFVFLNNNNYKIYVIKEKKRFISVRESRSGNLIKLRVKKLKSKATRKEAQRDLYEYAMYRGWQRI
jgi:hypothetical protein